MDHYETSPVAVRTETAARMFDTTPVSIVNWIKKGKLPGKKVGRVWYVRVADLQALVEAKGAAQ